MEFCPYYDKQCPENTDCARWDNFGCSARYRIGIPAVRSGTNVYIIHIEYADPKCAKDEVVVYADATTGVIAESGDIHEFTIYIP